MKYDCIIGGGGPSGICAGIAYARYGKKVLIIEDSSLLGGANILSLVGPLMTFHHQGKRIIGGIGENIITRLINKNGSLGDIKDPLGFCDTVTPIDTESLKELYFELIDEYNIDLLLHTKIIGINKKDDRIISVKVATKNGVQNIRGKVFIDATGDGDMAYWAKEDYTFGRESDNLCQPMTMPFVVGNVDIEKLKEAIRQNKKNFVIRKDYDYQYLGISGFFGEVEEAHKKGIFTINRDRVLLFENVKPNTVTINMTRVNFLSNLNVKSYTQAEQEGRRQIKECFDFLKQQIPGFENATLEQTPYQIGVRESRHIDCLYNVTKEDVLKNRCFSDTICISGFPMDIHSPNNQELEVDNSIINLAFTIPMRSIIPKKTSNLIITGRAIGATHEACASLRVTPVCMALGEAAGYLAYLALKENGNIKKVSYDELKKLLIDNNCILEF